MNTKLNSIPRTTLHKIRPYQSEAIGEITDGTKEAIREQLHTDALFSSAILIEMATGSGKTFTVGQYMDRMFHMIKRHPYLRESMKHLKVVLISNRIDGVGQFRDDLTIGRIGNQPKPPILSRETLAELRISTYHSQADGEDLRSRSEQTEISNVLGEHELICVTDKTAKLHNIAEQISHVDLIIVDEAHNTNLTGDLFDVLTSLEHKGRAGRSPLILALTATPSNITKELFGESRFTFGLPEYLASGHAPHVDYHIVANMSADESQVRTLEQLIAQAQQEKNYREKKAILSEAASLFESMQLPGDTKEFVEDLIARAGVTNEAGIKQLEETVIFVSSIDEADEIARHLDPSRSGYALSYHSDNDANRAIDRLRDPQDPCKVIIAIGKLNESIDLPVVKNVVFYRNTSSAKIYLQQFGRGLRGDGTVRYYDYTASFKNFAWIDDIYQEYQNRKKINNDKRNGAIGIDDDFIIQGERESSHDTHGFHITYGKLHGMEYGADLSRIGLTIGTLQKQLDTLLMPTKEEIKQWLTEQYGSTEDILKLTGKQITTVKHPVGGKVISLVKLSGWENRGKLDVVNPSGFQAWMRWMHDLEEVKILTKEETQELVTKEEIKEFLTKQYGSTEDILKLNGKQITILKHPVGGKVTNLATLSGWENPGNLHLQTPSGFQAWVRWVYDLEALNKEEIKQWLTEKYGSTEDILKLNGTQISTIEHPVGGKIIHLATLSGWENPGNLRLHRSPGFQAWVRWMYDLEEVKVLMKEEIKEFLTKQYGSTEDILKLNGKQITILKHPVGGKVTNLATLSGWENPGNLHLQTPSGFQAWVRWVYDLEALNKEEIKQWLTEKYGSTEDILKLNGTQISTIEHPVGGKIIHLATLSGWENPGNLRLDRPSGFQAWVRWIYDLEEVKALNKEEIKKFLTMRYGCTEDILKLNGTQISTIEHPFGGKVTNLATLSGWENPGNLQLQTPSGFQAWVRWVYDLEEVKILTKEEIQELVTKEEIKEFLTTQYGCTEDMLKLTKEQIKAIEHPFGGKVTNLAKLSGWENPRKLHVLNSSGFQAWVRWMYNVR